MVAVGDWWALLVVREIFLGAVRFTDIQRNLGVAKNVLSARLKKLVQNGVIETRANQEGQPSYGLTAKGRDLERTLLTFAAWGERWLPADPAAVAPDAAPSPVSRSWAGLKDRPAADWAKKL